MQNAGEGFNIDDGENMSNSKETTDWQVCKEEQKIL